MGKTVIFCLLILSLFQEALAKNINIYDTPSESGKITTTINPQDGIIIIYQPQKSHWVKVGNPKTGDVGWIKNEDLSQENSVEYSLVRRVTTPDKQYYKDMQKFYQWQVNWLNTMPIFMPIVMMPPIAEIQE